MPPSNGKYRWTITWNELSVPLPEPAVVRKQLDDLDWKFIFQLERGASAERAHYQMSIKLPSKGKKRKSELLGVLAKAFPTQAMAAFHVRETHSEEGSFTYCMKPDTRVDGPWVDKVRVVPPRPNLFTRGQQVRDDPYPWQAALIARLEKEPDNRSIMWLADPDGANGKTSLLEYCEEIGKFGVTLPYAAKPHQLAGYIKGMREDREFTTVFFDLPRAATMEKDPHKWAELAANIEMVKDGRVQSALYGKYVKVTFAPPHVVIFANALCPVPEAWTPDRLVPLTIAGLEAEFNAPAGGAGAGAAWPPPDAQGSGGYDSDRTLTDGE